MHTNVLIRSIAAGLLGLAAMDAHAGLFTSDFGSLVPGYAPNDDSSFHISLPFDVNYFGTSHSSLYVNNNGNATLGGSTVAFSPGDVTTEALQEMIAPYWTDLTSVSDPLGAIAPGSGGSGVYYNQTSPSQVVVTWDRLGYFGPDYSGRAQFQLVLNDTSHIPAGEGAIGFFYGDVTAPASSQQMVSIGVGDGLPAVNPGEVSVALGPAATVASAVSGQSYWIGVPNSGPGTPGQPGGPGQPTPPGGGTSVLSAPDSLALLGVGLAGMLGLRRRS